MAFPIHSRSVLLLSVVAAIVLAISAVPVSAEFESYFKPVASLDNPLTVDYSKYFEVWGDEIAAAAAIANRGGRKLLQYDSTHPDTCSNTPSAQYGNWGLDITCPGCQYCYSWGCFQTSGNMAPYNRACGINRVNEMIYCARFPKRCGLNI